VPKQQRPRHGPIPSYSTSRHRRGVEPEYEFCFNDRYWRCRCGTWTFDEVDVERSKARCTSCGKKRPRHWASALLEKVRRFGGLLAIALIATACAASAPRSAGPPGQIVTGRDQCLSIWHCPRFRPYWRASDPQNGEVHWLVSDRGWGCIVSARDYVMAPAMERFGCQWRAPR
jgi:hypothetical protein